jgi:hypothetical protein
MMSRFEIKQITATMLSKREYNQRMRMFPDTIAYKWKEHALRESCNDDMRPPSECFRPWFIHPIVLGGDVTYANFAIITLNLEERWHNFIFSQTGSMRPKDKKSVLIPTMKGNKAWWDSLFKCNFGG